MKILNENNLPEVGKTYNCFDDGKIRESRRYEVTIKELIPFKDIDIRTLSYWKNVILQCHWLYAKETDYFIISTRKDEDNACFVRTLDGGWFGIGDMLNAGRLDIDGTLTEKMNSYENNR